MAKYGENLPAMEEEPLPDSGVSSGEAGIAAVLTGAQMRCGGCGAKVGSFKFTLQRFPNGSKASKGPRHGGGAQRPQFVAQTSHEDGSECHGEIFHLV